VKQCPETPTLDAATEFAGHVWIQELPTGGEFRFQVAPSGLVTFATAKQSVDTADSVPMAHRRAARVIDEQLDRDALAAATDDPGDVTFCGIATRNEGVEYDWESVPAFVGVDVWSGRNERFLSPDAVTGVYERLGLPALPAVEKERPAAHADFTRFEDRAGFPQSAWRDGPAAGVLIRDKAGGRAAAWWVDRTATQAAVEQRSAVDLAAAHATPERIEQTITMLQRGDDEVSVDTIRDRLVTDVAREAYVDLFSDGEFVASSTAFRSAVAERVQQHQFTPE